MAATVLAVACGGTEPSTVSTDPTASVTEPSVTEPSVTAMPIDRCTPAAVDAVVRAELDPDGTIPGSVEIAECQNGYARVFYRPDAPNYETEQLFLRDDGGEWTILTYGTGIDCAGDTDLQPPELEDACRALGLRP
jgi:hypothetical protein